MYEENRCDLFTDIFYNISKAFHKQHLNDKRQCFEAAYASLRTAVIKSDNVISLNHQKAFFQLVFCYALYTCYQQEAENDIEYGTRQSARLMELSLCMLLKELKLEETCIHFNWMNFDNLDSLVSYLEPQADQAGKFFHQASNMNIDAKMLTNTAIELDLQKHLALTLILLTYSYQGLSKLHILDLHTRLYTYTLTAIGDGTVEQKVYSADFICKQAPFLTTLEIHNSLIYVNKQKSIQPAINYRNNLSKTSLERLALDAKLYYLKGLFLFETGNPEKLSVSKQFFEISSKLYQKRLSTFKKNTNAGYQNEIELTNVHVCLCRISIAILSVSKITGEYMSRNELQTLKTHEAAISNFVKKMESRGDTQHKARYMNTLETCKEIYKFSLQMKII